MNEVSELVEVLKGYEKQGLNTKEAMVKLFEEKDFILSEILEAMGEKKEIALSKLIEKLEQKDPMKRLFDAIDAFADEEKNYPVQKV